MRIYSNGFNLYGQLIKPNSLIHDFDVIFESEVIKNFGINHSFSYFHTDDSFLLYPKINRDIFIETKKIGEVASNDERIIILYDDGNLVQSNYNEEFTIQNVPRIWDNEETNDKIISVSCGSKINVIYTEQKRLGSITSHLKFQNDDIVQMKCGREHCILLDKTGNVYSFGRGR